MSKEDRKSCIAGFADAGQSSFDVGDTVWLLHLHMVMKSIIQTKAYHPVNQCWLYQLALKTNNTWFTEDALFISRNALVNVVESE